MKSHFVSPKFLVGSLLLAVLSASGLGAFAKPEAPKTPKIAPPLVTTQAKPTPIVAPIAAPTATPVAPEIATLTEPEQPVNLLEVFPVQEPLNYSERDKQDGPIDEATIAAKAAAGEVWVNSKSGVFHAPNTTYYGKTKKGFFMPEAEAIAKGYRSVK